MGFGTALAQGLVMGVGRGTEQYFLDQRQDKRDAKQLARKFDNFKKEADYTAALQAEQTKQKQKYEQEVAKSQEESRLRTSKQLAKFQMGYKDITAKNEALSEWEKVAKLSTQEIVHRNAVKASLYLPKGERDAFVRDFMQRNSGIMKVAALNQGGYTLPDYSQYANNPDFADAIPKARIAGLEDMPGMDEVFTYEPPAEDEGGTEELAGEKWQQELLDRRNAYKQSITNNGTLIQQGITDIDPTILNQIDSALQFGKQDATYVDSASGTEINRVDDEVIRGLTNGTMAVVDGVLMPMTKAQKIQELQMELEQPEGPEAAEGTPELPKTSQEVAREEKLTTEETKRYRTGAKEIGKKLANENITGVVDAIQVAEDDLKGLDPEALAYVYSALNEAQGSPKLAIDAIRKSRDPAAVDAAKALQSLMGVLNVELKDRSGAAVTEAEAQRFFAELGRASAVGSLEETLKGLSNLRGQKLSKVEGYFQGQEEGTINQFFETSPKYREYFDEHETYGSEEGKARGSIRKEVQNQAKALLDQKVDPQEINEYLQAAYGADAEQLGIELPTF